MRKTPQVGGQKVRNRRAAPNPPPVTGSQRRIDPEKREAIAQYLRDNPEAKRNETAERFGVSAGTITNISREVGRTFDRAASADATKARAQDVEKRAVLLAERMVEKAHELLDTWDQPYLVFNFGGRDNEYNEHTLDSPPIEVRRQIVSIAAVAVDKMIKIKRETATGSATESAFDAFLKYIAGDEDGDAEG